MKKTKIVATIGPASEDEKILRSMIESGMNVARLNFSHGSYDFHENIIHIVRRLSRELKTPVGILADLQGPRVRVGNEEPFKVKNGEVIFVSGKKRSMEKELVIDCEDMFPEFKIGDRILVEDGIIELKIAAKEGRVANAEVVSGGMIKPRKGVNIPDTKVNFGALTKKDLEDLDFSLRQDVDFVAMSFVSNAEEIMEARGKIRKILKRQKNLPQIVAKIERYDAIRNLDEIISAADAVMVARGDLGIELSESKVILYQKQIIAKCLKKSKPVIVATQMLDSMINNPIPTRAEVSDVSNAVIDHTDAVMLSGESANGKYPIETIKRMKDIIINTEESPFDNINQEFLRDDFFSDYAVIVNSAYELAKNSQAKAIVMFSESGYTARLMSHCRPEQLMLVATNNEKTYQQLSLAWGIRCYMCQNGEERENFIQSIIKETKKEKMLVAGDKIVVILGKMAGARETALIGIQELK